MSCFLRKLGLYDCLVDFPRLFPELLTNINQIQQRILKCITLSHILCQYESKLRSAPSKQVGSVAATRHQKVTVLQPSVFIKLKFVQLLVGLLRVMQTGADVWRRSGVLGLSSGTIQGTTVLSY